MHSRTRSLAIAAVLAVVAASPAFAGPPWMSIEYPANPHDRATRGAYLTIRTYHHGQQLDFAAVVGTAEGIVNGRRVSQTLEIESAGAPGRYVVRWSKPAEGTWTLVIRGQEHRRGETNITAMVDVGDDGLVAAVRIPSDRNREGWSIPRAVSASDIDGHLRRRAVVAVGRAN